MCINPYGNPNKTRRTDKAIIQLFTRDDQEKRLGSGSQEKGGRKASVTGEQSSQCFRLSVEQTKAAFYFHRDASWTYSLREELLSLKKATQSLSVSMPLISRWHFARVNVDLRRQIPAFGGIQTATTCCSSCLALHISGDSTNAILISLLLS